MDSHWRYATVAPDYEEVQRELRTLPFLRMREEETYYAYARRMELLVERATELRESALGMRTRGRTETCLETFDLRNFPSSSTRPPTRPVTSHFPRIYQPMGSAVFSPRPYLSPTLSSPRPESSPRPYQTPHYSPRAPVSERPLGLYARGAPTVGGASYFEGSPSRREYSTWGYTGIESSTDDEEEPTFISEGSGYRIGEPGVGRGRGAGRVGTRVERAEAVVGVVSGASESSAAVAESAASTSEIVAWVPESPVVEVLVISSAEEPANVEVHQGEEDSEMLTETVTSEDSPDDPDYTVGS